MRQHYRLRRMWHENGRRKSVWLISWKAKMLNHYNVLWNSHFFCHLSHITLVVQTLLDLEFCNSLQKNKNKKLWNFIFVNIWHGEFIPFSLWQSHTLFGFDISDLICVVLQFHSTPCLCISYSHSTRFWCSIFSVMQNNYSSKHKILHSIYIKCYHTWHSIQNNKGYCKSGVK